MLNFIQHKSALSLSDDVEPTGWLINQTAAAQSKLTEDIGKKIPSKSPQKEIKSNQGLVSCDLFSSFASLCRGLRLCLVLECKNKSVTCSFPIFVVDVFFVHNSISWCNLRCAMSTQANRTMDRSFPCDQAASKDHSLDRGTKEPIWHYWPSSSTKLSDGCCLGGHFDSDTRLALRYRKIRQEVGYTWSVFLFHGILENMWYELARTWSPPIPQMHGSSNCE